VQYCNCAHYLVDKTFGRMSRGRDFVVHHALGRPIPLDEHAVSVTLATWADVVGYEEGEKRVSEALQSGYPRFKVHASTEKLVDHVVTGYLEKFSLVRDHWECMLLPTVHVAREFVAFLSKDAHPRYVGSDCSVVKVDVVATGGFVVDIVAVGYEDLRIVVYPRELKLHVCSP
jgi:hypothetical protein